MKPATYIWSLVVLACALCASGCGGGKEPPRAPGKTLTVYESLPHHGVSARTAAAVAAGSRLALADARGHAGGKRVRLVELDSSKPGGTTWDPATVEANARRAAADPTTIAYLGELDDGASAISLPVTNNAGILQIAPLDGLTDLTRDEPGGAPAARPARFYPSGKPSFLRLVPTDYEQAATIAGWARARGARRVAVVQDDRLMGRELATQVRYAATRLGMTVVDGVEADDDPTTYPALAKRLSGDRADAVIYTGVGSRQSGALLAAIAHAMPRAPIFTGSGMATAEPAPPGLPQLNTLKPALAPSAYGPRARRLLARLARGHRASAPAEALYGYEAMRILIDALDAAGAHSADRAAVARAALEPRPRRSAIGDYRVIAGGDVAPARFGSFRRQGEALAYQGARTVPRALR